MVLNRKIKRNMIHNKSTYLITFILLILSTALFTVFNTSIYEINKNINQFKDEYKVADANFSAANKLIDIKELESKFNVVIEEMKYKDVLYNNTYIRVYQNRSKLNLVKGDNSLIKVNDNQIYINKEFYNNHNLNVGDKININNKEFILKGISNSPDYIHMLQNSSSVFANKQSFAIAFINKSDFESFDSPSICYGIKFNKDNRKEFKKYINENNVLTSWTDKQNDLKISAINGDLEAFSVIGDTVPLVIILLVSLLIGIVLWRLVRNEISQLGTLYALGYNKKKIVKHYMFYPLFITIISGIIGQVLSFFCTDIFKRAIEIEYSLPEFTINMNFKYMIISILLPVIIIVPLNLIVILFTLKHKPIDLIKNKLQDNKISFFEKLISKTKLSFRRKFQIKDLARNKGRSILTFCSIVFSSILLFFVFYITDSLDNIIIKGYDEPNQYSYMYNMESYGTEDVNGEKIWNIPVYTKQKGKDEISFMLEGHEKSEKLFVLKDDENNTLSFNDVIITKSLANRLNIKQGDTLKFYSNLDETIFKVKIDHVAKTYLNDVLYVPIDLIYKETEIPDGSYSCIISNDKINFKNDKLASITTKDDMLIGIFNLVSPLRLIMYFVGIVASIIGAALIYVIISMVIDENKINISMFKILGYSNRKITSIILNLNDLIVLFAYICSIFISKYVINMLFIRMTRNTQYTLEAKISIDSVLIVTGILWLIYEFSKIATRRKILKIPMEEVLKNERE